MTQFLGGLTELGGYIVVSFTHLVELLRHNNGSLVRSRLYFLRTLPLVAWPRPYDRSWFVGSNIDIARRELHAFLHDNLRGYGVICDGVRSELWETGIGNDMFPDRDEFWEPLIERLRLTLERDRYVASFAAIRQAGVSQMTLGEARKRLASSPSGFANGARRLADNLTQQLLDTGDKKLDKISTRARQFAKETQVRVQNLLSKGGDFAENVGEDFGVPRDLIHDGLTVGKLGELAALTRKLQVLARGLNPPADADIRTVPQDSLPTVTFDDELLTVQQGAKRVAGSDLGDGHLAALAMYADVTEVDKRTYEYISQVARKNDEFISVLRPIVKSTHYNALLNRIQAALDE